MLSAIIFNGPVYAQKPVLQPDNAIRDTTLRPDSIKTNIVTKKSAATDGVNSKVTYSAEDSVTIDKDNNIVYLYGKGHVKYEDFELDADYIRLDQKNNTVFAKGITNPQNNRYSGRPLVKQGSEHPLTTDSLFFNYKTKKGKSYGVFTDVEGGYLQAQQFKKNEYDEGFFKRGIYSTCNLPHPHFGIHITRGIATDKQIITGPAYLVIEDVPLPIGVPFGFFPKPNRRSGGLLFPTFGEDTRGFFMRDLGYYLGLNDYWDLATRGTLYSKGSYELSTAARYRKNYKYDGGLNFRFASTRNGVEGTPSYKKPNKDFNLTWNHSQSPQANPGTTFSASVNAGTGSYFQNTGASGTYNPTELARNTLSSSISYGKTFANGLFNFTTSLRHNQDIERRTVDLYLPIFSLAMTNTIYPFDNKDRIGDQKWYQKIGFGYSMQGSNTINTTEDKLFKKESLNDFRNGIQHDIPISLSMNILNYFQFNSGMQYSEKWYLQTIRKRLNPVASGFAMATDTVQGFSRVYDYSLNSGLSTKVYGKFNFKKGNLMALRHVMTPSVGFNYRPDFGDERFGYFRNVQGDTAKAKINNRYSIYENAVFGSPSTGRVAGIGFSVDNNIEAKVRSTADSTKSSVNIPILQSLTFSGNYNFAAENFKLSTIGFSGRTAFFKQKIGINFYGTLDPYQLDQLGSRIDKFTLSSGKVARLTNFGLSTDFSLNSTAFKKRNEALNEIDGAKQNLSPQQQEELNAISRDPNAFVDFNIPWNISAAYSFNYSKNGFQSSISNTLNFYGDFNVTPKWKVQYTSGYDFQANKLSLTQFSIYRDLHCWDLSFRWSPIGNYKFYSVDLRVKASILQDLKLSKRRDSYNNF